MQYVNLGQAGLKVSRICLGMMSYGDTAWREWTLSEDDGRPIIRRAAELGVNFYDTASSA
jgi:1-deoxyxylulose-5-phosphate synthase